jgi:hypothetical protein
MAIKSEQIAGELAGPPFPAPAVGVTRSSSARSRSQRIARLRRSTSPVRAAQPSGSDVLINQDRVPVGVHREKTGRPGRALIRLGL